MDVEQVTSRDGTVIAYHRLGDGPPLVLAAGTGAANPRAWPATAALAARFTVCAMDRRGHGLSGDGADYSLRREAEDVAAVVDAAAPVDAGTAPAALLGHSYGALVALEAALLARNLSKLILYEPGFALGGAPMYAPGMIARHEALLAAGDREGVLTLHYGELAGLSPEEIAAMRAAPAWPERLAAAHTVPREMRAEEGYVFNAGRFQALAVPTLLITGADTAEFLAAPTRALSAALPHRRLAVLPGQQHIAMYTAPELFAGAVIDFLDEQL
jgi:pimeloyl-ACP methyl ester carboxylesterase